VLPLLSVVFERLSRNAPEGVGQKSLGHRVESSLGSSKRSRGAPRLRSSSGLARNIGL
jgi:hypothetical protein